jgi:hypothetical protein
MYYALVCTYTYMYVCVFVSAVSGYARVNCAYVCAYPCAHAHAHARARVMIIINIIVIINESLLL